MPSLLTSVPVRSSACDENNGLWERFPTARFPARMLAQEEGRERSSVLGVALAPLVGDVVPLLRLIFALPAS